MKLKLRNNQREWINWRDEKCDEVQEKSGCNENGSCNGVAHDYCIINLTRQRDDELQKLLRAASPLGDENFSFSKQYN